MSGSPGERTKATNKCSRKRGLSLKSPVAERSFSDTPFHQARLDDASAIVGAEEGWVETEIRKSELMIVDPEALLP